MFSAFKNYGLAIVSVIASVLLALLYRSKAKYEKTIRNASEEARATENRATEAMVEGLSKEAKARAEIEKRIAEFARGKRP